MTEPTLLPVEEESGTAPPVSTGPGKRLRDAREAQKLSVSKVANLLHLDPRLVGALEHNDYEHLPEPIYVTGYLRNYARLLDLPEEEVVSSYQRLDMPPPPILSELTRKTRHRAPLNHVLIQWGVVGLVGVGLVLITWHMSTRRPAPAESGPDTPVLAEAASPAPAAGAASAKVPAAAPAAKAPAGADADASAAAGGTDAPAPPSARGTVHAVPAPAPAAPVVADANAAPAGEAGPQDGGAAGEPVQTAAADSATVVLTFDHDSWVEMTDADGRRVFFDLGKAGQTRTVHGVPPFKVLLGYAPGVTIEYNGKPFDQSSFTGHNNVAHFTMGAKH